MHSPSLPNTTNSPTYQNRLRVAHDAIDIIVDQLPAQITVPGEANVRPPRELTGGVTKEGNPEFQQIAFLPSTLPSRAITHRNMVHSDVFSSGPTPLTWPARLGGRGSALVRTF